MQLHVALPKSSPPLRLVFDSGRKLSDSAYWEFCQQNPDLRVERSAEGEIIIVPPALKRLTREHWFIDGDAETAYVYRQGQPVEKRRGVRELAGEGPVKGFVLELRPIWEGLG